MKTKIVSPLIYPGAKTKAAKEILQYFPKGLKKICSPFFGGGSLEILLSQQGLQVSGYDIFEPLVNFWQVFLKDQSKFAEEVKKYYPILKDDFYNYQKNYSEFSLDKEQQAHIFYVLNRASFSGTTFSGGMSPNHKHFNPTMINKLPLVKADNILVECLDFQESLEKHKNDFLYLDPPYFLENSNLYGNKGSTHKNFEHNILADILKGRNSWIMSYNDCLEVRSLYNGYQIFTPLWKYSMGTAKNKSAKISTEVLILSHDLVNYEDLQGWQIKNE